MRISDAFILGTITGAVVTWLLGQRDPGLCAGKDA